MKGMPLSVAVNDPALLGGRINWRPRQRELLASLDGPETMHIWCLGRQSGKSSMAAAAAVSNAALRPDLDELMPAGEWRTVPVISPSEDQSRAFLAKAAAAVEASPLIASYAEVFGDRVDFNIPRTDATGRKFTARTRVVALAANSKSMRGYTGAMVCVEEGAHLDETTGPGSDRRIFEAIGPTLARFGSLGCLLVISSAYGESGLYHELLQQVLAGEIPNARAAVHTTAEMWPDVDTAFLDAERRRLGREAFEREYECVASTGTGSFFADLSAYALDSGPAPPDAGKGWVAALDPAWSRDSFGYAVIGESTESAGMLVCGALGAIKPERTRSFARKRKREDSVLRAVWEAVAPYRPRIVTDQTNADAIKHHYEREEGATVKVVHVTGPIQAQAFTVLRSRLDDGSLTLWRCPELLDELRRVSVKGADKIHLRRSGDSHVDIGCAVALGAYELRHITDAPVASPRAGGRPIMSGFDGVLGPGTSLGKRTPGDILRERDELERAGIPVRPPLRLAPRQW